MDYLSPFKIEIERNTDMQSSSPFFVTINGKRFDNVKRFYIDLDKDKLLETHREGGNIETIIKPWVLGVEYESDPFE